MGAPGHRTMGRVTTRCHAPLASPSGHNMSPAHYHIIMSVNMATQSPGPQVAMFPHVPDRSLGFSFTNVLRPSARYCQVRMVAGWELSRRFLTYSDTKSASSDKLYWIIQIFTDTQILSISPIF